MQCERKSANIVRCRDNGTLDSYVGLLVAEDGKHLVEKFLLFESYCSKLLFKDLVVGKF